MRAPDGSRLMHPATGDGTGEREMTDNVFTVERIIRASPEAIFDILADPAQHSLIDGSGMVQGCQKGELHPLALGVTFGMSMKMGISYATASTVVEFEENRRIAWQTGPKGKLEPYVAGRIWRSSSSLGTTAPWCARAGTSPAITSASC